MYISVRTYVHAVMLCHYCTVPAAAADDDAMLMHKYATRSDNKPCNGASEPNECIYDATAQRICASELANWAAIISSYISFSRAVRLCPIELQLYIRVVIYYVTTTSAYHHHHHATCLIPTRNIIKYATVLLHTGIFLVSMMLFCPHHLMPVMPIASLPTMLCYQHVHLALLPLVPSLVPQNTTSHLSSWASLSL